MLDKLKPYSTWAGVGVMLVGFFWQWATAAGRTAQASQVLEQRVATVELAQRDSPTRREFEDLKAQLIRIEDKLDRDLMKH